MIVTLAKFLLRLAFVLLIAICVSGLIRALNASLERRPHPAGFARGLLQGALMPMALPNLALGRDVTIYAQNNNGIGYKLGYTTGVNACGAIFFGLVFWRFSRWRTGRRPKT